MCQSVTLEEVFSFGWPARVRPIGIHVVKGFDAALHQVGFSNDADALSLPSLSLCQYDAFPPLWVTVYSHNFRLLLSYSRQKLPRYITVYLFITYYYMYLLIYLLYYQSWRKCIYYLS